MSPNEIRTLVGAVVNPANETKQIMSLIQDRVAALTTKLSSLHMHPYDILRGYKECWWSAIKYVSPSLKFFQQSSMLIQFHHSLLPQIKVNRNFKCALIPISPDF